MMRARDSSFGAPAHPLPSSAARNEPTNDPSAESRTLVGPLRLLRDRRDAGWQQALEPERCSLLGREEDGNINALRRLAPHARPLSQRPHTALGYRPPHRPPPRGLSMNNVSSNHT